MSDNQRIDVLSLFENEDRIQNADEMTDRQQVESLFGASTDPWASLRKAETLSAPPIVLSTGKTIPGPEGQAATLTGEESVEYSLRNRMPQWLNEQINYVYEHPGRFLLETGASIAGPEAAAAKWGATVPGRMAVRGLSGAVSGTLSSLAAESFDPTEKPLSHALTIGAYSALGETFGELTATGANALLARGRRFEPAAREAFEQLRGEAVPSPGQLSKSAWIDVMENVTHSTVFGHAAIQDMRDASQAAAQVKLDRFVREYLGREGIEAIGGTLQSALELSNQIYKDAGHKFYDVLFGLADAAKVQSEVTGALSAGSGISKMRLNAVLSRVETEGKRSPTAQKAVKWILDEFGDRETISLREAHALRTDLRTMVPTPEEPMPAKASRYPEMLINSLTKEMQRYASELGPDIARQLKIADTYWSALHEVFGDKFIKALLAAEPETVLRKVTPEEMPGTVRRIRNIILDPKLKGLDRIDSERIWEQVQGYVMMRIARRAEDADLEVIGRRGLKGLRRYWDETLEEIFSDKKALSQFKELLTTLKITQGEIGKGIPGGIATRLMQAGILFDLPRQPGRVVRFFVPVWMVKRLFTNEKFVYWAAIGSKAPPGSLKAVRAFTQMQAIFEGERKMQEYKDVMMESVRRTQRARGVQP